MKLKFSNNLFYQRHADELKRYQVSENVLNIINTKSSLKMPKNNGDNLFVDSSKDSLKIIDSLVKNYKTIILTDVIEDVFDIYNFLLILSKKLDTDGKLVISSINTRWRIFAKIFETLKLKDRTYLNSYIHHSKIKNIVTGLGFEFISSYSRQFFPFKLFGLGTIFNLATELLFYRINFGIKTYSVFRKVNIEKNDFKKSIIIPAKNEAGNIENLFQRIPNKEECQIIFSLGNSTDNTNEIVARLKNKYQDCEIDIVYQKLTGKANAVWDALKISNGELIAILDADISVDPKVLPNFFEIIERNSADFVNGTRLIYEMEKGSMRIINKIGNRIFQFIIGNLIKVNLTDSLCGTKVFKKELISNILWWQEKINFRDPFGDFDLIFSAAYSGQKIVEFPVHYQTRIYGKTQISRFRDGFKLINYLFKSYVIFNSSRRIFSDEV